MEKTENIHEQRLEYMDLYKGIGIMLMIFGHVSFWGTMDHLIHAFNMPMFFIASGFFYNKRTIFKMTFAKFLQRKAKALLIPYFVFGIINYVINGLINGFDINPLKHLLWVNNHDIAIAGALWFITALLITESIYFILDRYCFLWLKIVMIALFTIVGAMARIIFPYTLPWTMSAAFVGVLFYFIGVLIKQNAEKIFAIKLHFAVILSAIEIILIFTNGELNMRNEEYAFIPLSLTNAIVSSVLLLYFCKYIDDACRGNIVNRILCSIGKNSMVYVCLNQLVILLVFMGVEPFGLHRYISKLICYIVSSIVLYLVAKIISETWLKVLIGRGF